MRSAKTAFIMYLSIALTACATFDSTALGGDEFDADADEATVTRDAAAIDPEAAPTATDADAGPIVYEDGDRLPDSGAVFADTTPIAPDVAVPSPDTKPPLDTTAPPPDTTAPPPDTTPPPPDTTPPPPVDTKLPPPEVGGSPGTPGNVKCGGPLCNITTNWCVYSLYDPYATPYCSPYATGGYGVKCDEKSDCVARGMPAAVCCKGTYETDCVASCSSEKTLP